MAEPTFVIPMRPDLALNVCRPAMKEACDVLLRVSEYLADDVKAVQLVAETLMVANRLMAADRQCQSQRVENVRTWQSDLRDDR